VAALPLAGDGTVGEPRVVHHAGHGADPKRQASAHPHCVVFSPDHRFVVSCDLGLDRIFSYRLDPARAELSPADPPFVAVKPGAGPRHFVFAAGGRRGYAITELSSTIVAYDYDSETGSLSTRETVSTLPAGFAGESIAAEICLHPNGRFLYASNRGHDSLAVFAIDAVSGALSPVEIVPCGGKGPRNFSLSPDGAWLVCAHQESNSLCSFRVDSATGRLARVEGGVSIPTPVCVLFYD
jgi:6-phosphogluconolactonase